VADLYTYEAGQSPLPGLAVAPPPDEVREVANCVAALEYDLAQPELDRPARVHPERADYAPWAMRTRRSATWPGCHYRRSTRPRSLPR
jgi:hypothetical protein